jgi:alpha-mannosidase
MEAETRPQYTWTAVHDPSSPGRGLAVVSTGLPESAVCDMPDRPIALTLLRSFIKAFLTDGNEGGQMQGTHEFAYLLVPWAGALPRTRLCRLGQQLAAAPRCVQIEHRDLLAAPSAALPPSQSFLQIDPGRAVVTAIHAEKGSAGLIVRMFNPNDETVVETLRCAQPIRMAERIDLEGNRLEVLTISADGIRTSLAARQIVSLRLR